MNTQKKSMTDHRSVAALGENLRGLAGEAARETVDYARQAADEAYDYGRRKVARGMSDIQGYVRKRPIQALSIALGAGVVLGYLMRRGRS